MSEIKWKDEMEVSAVLYGMAVVLYNPDLSEPKVLSRQEIIDLGKHMEQNTLEIPPLPKGKINPITEFLKEQENDRS